MNVLGIETSCDETGVAVYSTDSGLIADALHSQVDLHAVYGGVVPELASRDHVRKTLPLIHQALEEAGVSLQDLDRIYISGGGQSLYHGILAVVLRRQASLSPAQFEFPDEIWGCAPLIPGLDFLIRAKDPALYLSFDQPGTVRAILKLPL